MDDGTVLLLFGSAEATKQHMKPTESGHDPAYLLPTRFVDSDHPDVVAFARDTAGPAKTDVERAVRLFYAVRDRIRYDPYTASLEPESFKASVTLRREATYCIPKAILLTAAARAVGIPGRLGFADVRNHLATERLLRILRTDRFIFHGYSELFLDDRWVKATPTFNLSLCEKFGVKPLEFNGRDDSMLHPYDRAGNRHMEYVHSHGVHADLPLAALHRALREGYPHLFEGKDAVTPFAEGERDFEREVEQDQRRCRG